jgi:hypothetical protein
MAILPAFATQVWSADVHLTDWKLRTMLILEGEIVAGDYDKVEAAVQVYPHIGVVFIGSSGGNLYESMKIGRLLRQARWTTFAPPTDEAQLNAFKGQKLLKDDRNYICASSCFLIYVGGVERNGESLGLHRPYLMRSATSTLTAEGAIDFARKAESDTQEYLVEMDVPTKYAAIMFSTPSDDIYFLDAREVAGLHGLIPGLREWMEGKCGLSTVAEKQRLDAMWRTGTAMTNDDTQFFTMMMERMDKEDDCQREELTSLRFEASN